VLGGGGGEAEVELDDTCACMPMRSRVSLRTGSLGGSWIGASGV